MAGEQRLSSCGRLTSRVRPRRWRLLHHLCVRALDACSETVLIPIEACVLLRTRPRATSAEQEEQERRARAEAEGNGRDGPAAPDDSHYQRQN